MDFDDAREKLVAETKRVGHIVRDGAIAAELAWTTLGSPVPVQQQPNLEHTRDPSISWQIEHPSSIQQQTQNYAEHSERLQEERRRQAFEEGFALREPESRDERSCERGR